MSTTHHTPIATRAAATAATLNVPLSQLDSAIVTATAMSQAVLSSVGSGGWASTLDAEAASGQKVVPVASTTGAVAGMPVYIGLTGGSHEVGVIDTISAGVSVTLLANLAATYASGSPISATPAEVADARGAWDTLGERVTNSESRVFDTTRYATVQAAIDAAAAAGGGTVLVRGTNTIAAKLYPAPDVNLRGLGYDSVLSFVDDNAADNRGVELAAGTYNIVIENLRITSDADSRTGLYGLIRAVQAVGVTVRGCWIDTSPSVAIWLAECTNWDIDGNTLGLGWADGIHVSRGSKHIRIRGNDVTAAGDDGIAVIAYLLSGGLSVGNCEDIVISGNTIHNLPVGSGISIVGGDRITAIGNIINTTGPGAYNGINVSAAGDATYHPGSQIALIGNQIHDAGQEGIYIYGLVGGTIHGNTIVGSGRIGIFLLGVSEYVSVTGNYVTTSVSFGIAESDDGTGPNVYVANCLPANTGGAKNINVASTDQHNI